jgi:hypothetical protein
VVKIAVTKRRHHHERYPRPSTPRVLASRSPTHIAVVRETTEGGSENRLSPWRREYNRRARSALPNAHRLARVARIELPYRRQIERMHWVSFGGLRVTSICTAGGLDGPLRDGAALAGGMVVRRPPRCERGMNPKRIYESCWKPCSGVRTVDIGTRPVRCASQRPDAMRRAGHRPSDVHRPGRDLPRSRASLRFRAGLSPDVPARAQPHVDHMLAVRLAFTVTPAGVPAMFIDP